MKKPYRYANSAGMAAKKSHVDQIKRSFEILGIIGGGSPHELYERRKRELLERPLSPAEYESEVKRAAEESGV